MITDNYIKMCEQAPKGLWDGINHIGTLMAWRSFMGIVKPCEKRGKLEGLAVFIPETLVIRTWLKDDEDIMVTKTGMEYPGLDGDKGTPVYSQEQLQEMIDWELVARDDIIRELSGKANDLFNTDDPISWVEFWLMCVMSEKYNKIWAGEKWVG